MLSLPRTLGPGFSAFLPVTAPEGFLPPGATLESLGPGDSPGFAKTPNLWHDQGQMA